MVSDKIFYCSCIVIIHIKKRYNTRLSTFFKFSYLNIRLKTIFFSRLCLKMSKISAEDSYYCFGYANERVKKEFKSFFRNFRSLTEAINAFISLDASLCSKYRFEKDDIKYKLRAKPSSLDDPAELHEALLRWNKYVEVSNYVSMGCVVEELLMTRKNMISLPYYRACQTAINHANIANSMSRDVRNLLNNLSEENLKFKGNSQSDCSVMDGSQTISEDVVDLKDVPDSKSIREPAIGKLSSIQAFNLKTSRDDICEGFRIGDIVFKNDDRKELKVYSNDCIAKSNTEKACVKNEFSEIYLAENVTINHDTFGRRYWPVKLTSGERENFFDDERKLSNEFGSLDVEGVDKKELFLDSEVQKKKTVKTNVVNSDNDKLAVSETCIMERKNNPESVLYEACVETNSLKNNNCVTTYEISDDANVTAFEISDDTEVSVTLSEFDEYVREFCYVY